MNDQRQTSELARAVQDVTERAQILVREEIALAKAEVSTTVKKLAMGIVVGITALIFFLFGLIYFLHSAAWFAYEKFFADKLKNESLDNNWLGYLSVAGVIFLLGLLFALAAFLLIRKRLNPAPKMAIEEAQLIRQTVSGDSPTPARRDR